MITSKIDKETFLDYFSFIVNVNRSACQLLAKMTTVNDENLLEDTTPFWKRRRNHLALLVFIGFMIIYTLRFLLSVGIIGRFKIFLNIWIVITFFIFP